MEDPSNRLILQLVGLFQTKTRRRMTSPPSVAGTGRYRFLSGVDEEVRGKVNLRGMTPLLVKTNLSLNSMFIPETRNSRKEVSA